MGELGGRGWTSFRGYTVFRRLHDLLDFLDSQR
jgi:hypothetical protein